MRVATRLAYDDNDAGCEETMGMPCNCEVENDSARLCLFV